MLKINILKISILVSISHFQINSVPPKTSVLSGGVVKILDVKVKVVQLCLTLCDPMDCSPPGSSVHGILQARILEGVAMSSSRNKILEAGGNSVSFLAGNYV